MKIGWFTPFSRASAIAELSEHLVAELARHCDVELWITGAHDPRPMTVTMFNLEDAPPTDEQLASYDACVYHYGDHAQYHGPIHDAAIRRPGIVVLHDRVFQNLFAGMWMGRDHDPARYVERMGAWYGEDGLRVASDAVTGRRSQSWAKVEEVLRFPLFEEALIGATGVVTHSASHAAEISAAWGGQVVELFLPTYPTDWVQRPEAPDDGDPRLKLLTVGYVNPNKRVLEIVRTLAHHPDLAERIHYTVLGPFAHDSPYIKEIRREISRHGLDDTVVLLGWRPDSVLERHMAAADVFVNLRWPTLEGGSASLLRQLPWGKPVVAFDSGFFGELPAGSVVKVAPDDYDRLAADLRTLARDEGLRARIGSAGREAARGLTVERYVEGLLRFIDDVASWNPLTELCDRIGDELAAMGVDGRLPSVDAVSREVAAMFPARP
jgi:glycosyltransferase involved in cell wall biosynthesis